MSQSGSRTRQLLPYAVATLLAVVLVVVSINRSEPSAAAQELLDGEQMKIMAPADPGGGWDSTAREMQASLQELVGRTEVYNVGGAGGTIGLSNFRNLEGQPSQLMVMGLVMVGAIAANESSVTLDEVTPDRRAHHGEPGDRGPRRLRHPDDRRPGRRPRAGPRRGVVGRRLGGRRRADPGRADRPGPRARPRRRQLHRPRRRWRGDLHPAVGERDRRPQRRLGVPAPDRVRRPPRDRGLRHRAGRVAARRTHAAGRRASTSSSPTGAGSSRRRASPTRSVRR